MKNTSTKSVSVNPDFTAPKPFMTINQAAAFTGLGRDYIRHGCQNGKIPHVKSGNKYMVNIKKLLELDETA